MEYPNTNQSLFDLQYNDNFKSQLRGAAVWGGIAAILSIGSTLLGLIQTFMTKNEIPAEFRRNARRFLYYQLYRTSLPFGDFLEPSVRTTQTRLKTFQLDTLLNSDAVKVILDGVLNNGDFLLKE